MDLKLLKQIEYASLKDSLSEHERLMSVRSLVTAAISRTEATASTKSEGGVEGHATTPIGLGEARKAKPMSCSIQEGSHGARAGIKPGPLLCWLARNAGRKTAAKFAAYQHPYPEVGKARGGSQTYAGKTSKPHRE